MFARVKKSGAYQYLQLVENRREGSKTVQRVLCTIGRLDRLHAKGDVENLVRSLSRFSERVLLILSGKSAPQASAKKIGPSLIFERLWKELGIGKILQGLLEDRKFEFDVERAIFLTVLHRLMVSGSDRFCERWHQEYQIDGVKDLALHQWKRRCFMSSGICLQGLTWFSLTRRRSTLKAKGEQPSERKATVKITVQT